MANKLTPEEALKLIKEGLERCDNYMRLAYDSFGRTILSARLEGLKEVEMVFGQLSRIGSQMSLLKSNLKNCVETNLIPFPWRECISGLHEITKCADSAITKTEEISFSKHRVDMILPFDFYPTLYERERLLFFFMKVIESSKRIRKEIEALQAICEQLAK